MGPDLACGCGEEILDNSLTAFREYLAPELASMSEDERDHICGDFHVGCEQIMFLGKLKLSVVQVVPLLYMGLANGDEVQARKCAGKIVQQCEGTRGQKHHELTSAWADENCQMWKDIVDFWKGKERNECLAISEECEWLSMIRCNEVSAERLHRIGTLEAGRASNPSSVLLSFGFRSPEMREESLSTEDFQIWAKAAEEFRTPAKLIKRFGLQERPAVLEDRDRLLARGERPKETMCSHKVLREVFYRGDMQTIVDTHDSLKEAIRKAGGQLKEEMKKHLIDPLQAAKDALPEDDIKQHALSVKYGVQHFQETADENALYCLPVNCRTETLEEVFNGSNLGDAAENEQGIHDDTALPLDGYQAPTSRQSSVYMFRVLSFNPASAKLLPSPLVKARGDHVAVAPYVIEAREIEGTENLNVMVTSSLSKHKAAPTRLLSLSSFMNVEFSELMMFFLKANVENQLEYVFEGAQLPPEAYSPAARHTLRRLMQADAFPGPWCTYHLGGLHKAAHQESL